MTEPGYTTLMEPRHGALELIDVGAAAAAVTERWYNETLCAVNGSLLRLGVVQGEYHWHSHEGQDELFYVVEGRLRIDLEGRDAVELGPGQALVVSRGLRHRPMAPGRTVVLMVEEAGIVPTGDR